MPTTVLLVRHAEAVQIGDDAPLTDAGSRRAHALVGVAEHAGVDVVITSQYRRTKDTAAPLVEAGTIPAVEVPIGNVPEHVAAIVERITTEYAGKTVLVVGDNNTIPLIVQVLSGVEHPAIAHEDNTRLFMVTLGEKTSVIAAQYGCSP
jgi:broad specificity phosphatase PhoE